MLLVPRPAGLAVVALPASSAVASVVLRMLYEIFVHSHAMNSGQ